MLVFSVTCRPRNTVCPSTQATGQFFVAQLLGSMVFDCVHYASHAVSRRSFLARWHSHHHKFQDTFRVIHRRSRGYIDVTGA